MKHFLIPFIFVAAILAGIAGCGSDNPVAPNADVNFAIAQNAGTTGTEFYIKPSVDVKISKVIVALPSASFGDTIVNPNPNYIFSKDTFYYVGEYTGVTSGQQWQFTFSGFTASANQAFNKTVNYTVP